MIGQLRNVLGTHSMIKTVSYSVTPELSLSEGRRQARTHGLYRSEHRPHNHAKA
jgi:hypothetical protein